MPTVKYSDLIAWQKAMDLVVEAYLATEGFPQRETFGLTNQMRRAAVSLPSNIAEGQGRGSGKEFAHFLRIARGSLQELETQVLLAHRLRFLAAEVKDRLLAATCELSRILAGLIASIS
jgi:four helix bundle protein